MPLYVVQKLISGSGSWSQGQEFEADDDEDAKRRLAGSLTGTERLELHTPRRISRVVFEGAPTQTGYPLPPDEAMDALAARMAANEAEMYARAQSRRLTYDDEYDFVIKAVPEPLDGRGYELRLLYGAGYGTILSVTPTEVEHALKLANLRSGDITVSACYYDQEGATCVSVSKVVRFAADGTIEELIHLWPLEFPNRAIEAGKLRYARVEDKRQT